MAKRLETATANRQGLDHVLDDMRCGCELCGCPAEAAGTMHHSEGRACCENCTRNRGGVRMAMLAIDQKRRARR